MVARRARVLQQIDHLASPRLVDFHAFENAVLYLVEIRSKAKKLAAVTFQSGNCYCNGGIQICNTLIYLQDNTALIHLLCHQEKLLSCRQSISLLD